MKELKKLPLVLILLITAISFLSACNSDNTALKIKQTKGTSSISAAPSKNSTTIIGLNPEKPLTCGEFLWLLMDKTNQHPAQDDPIGSSIDVAIQKGYISDRLGVNKQITVQQATSIIDKAALTSKHIDISHYDWQIFDLKDAGSTFRDSIIRAYASGLIKTVGGYIKPNQVLLLSDAESIISRLIDNSQRNMPPDIEAPYFEYKNMVELIRLDPSLEIDLKYASNKNFTGKTHYPYSLCLMNKNAAKNLVLANKYFSNKGMHIKIWDAYRPESVQWSLFNSVPESKKKYAPAPSKYSQHCKGIAADITLVDSNGNEIPMPTGFDDFTDKAHADYKNLTAEVKQNRDFLINSMRKFGFEVNNLEWWHFYIPNTTDMLISEVTFDDFVKNRNEFYLETLKKYNPPITSFQKTIYP